MGARESAGQANDCSLRDTDTHSATYDELGSERPDSESEVNKDVHMLWEDLEST